MATQSDSQRPAVSLIVPIYNQSKWLPGLFGSILAQVDPPSFEVIFCDDGSSDKSSKLINKFQSANDLDVRYVWQPDKGFRASRTRNNGIRLAQGEVLAFIDGDTWLGPTFLRDHWEANQVPGRLVCGRRYARIVWRVSSSYQWFEPAPGQEVAIQPLKQEEWMAGGSPWMACCSGNFSVQNTGDVEFDENFVSWGSEDRDLAYRLFRDGRAPYVIQQPNALHQRYKNTHWTDMTHEQVVAFLDNKTYFASKFPNGEVLPSLGLTRRCHLTDGKWSIGAARQGMDAMAVLEEFQLWKQAPNASK